MATKPIPAVQSGQDKVITTAGSAAASTQMYENSQVLTIAAGHFVHDTYSAFLPTLLPLLIDKLALTLTQAGTVSAITQVPALLNPFIGYLADRVSLRYFVIFAPAVTATLFSSLGLAPSYLILAILLFTAGISTAAFHAPAPAIVTRISGRQLGKGMSVFMAGGELGRTLGPLLAVWGVTTWGLDGFWRVMVFGWAATALLYLRMRAVPARSAPPSGLLGMLPGLKRIALPLSLIVLLRSFSVSSISIFLPTYLDQQGSTLWVAGGALALAQGAGVLGALFSGPASDRWGRKMILAITIGGGGLFLLIFLGLQGWLLIPVLILMGLLTLSTQPVLLAVVQEHFSDHRAVANGLFMLITFIGQSLSVLAIGRIGDVASLESAYFWSALLSLLAVPAILLLPGPVRQ
jgi:FSR family fosmidomycin resistance protein-like MFS transporter